MKLSIVSTLYRSEDHLDEFHHRVMTAAAAHFDDVELVLVNDGSPDDSVDRAMAITEEDPAVRLIDLSRNFGHHRAMMCGLEYARGDLVFLIDSDLEEDPSLLSAFFARMQETGADVVYGVQAKRKGRLIERASARIFYGIFNKLSEHPIPANVLTIRLMTRRYVDSLLLYRERAIVIAGLWTLTGYDQVPLEVEKGRKGWSTYSLIRRFAVLVGFVVSYSNRPLIWISWLGALISVAAGFGAAVLVFRRVVFQEYLAGWPSLIVSVWFLGGLSIFCLGVIGLYLATIFAETKARPNVIIREIFEQGRSDEQY